MPRYGSRRKAKQKKATARPTISTHQDFQANCPLFTKVPAEIRNRIFSFALSAFEDYDHPYPPGERWCRPGYRYPQKLDLRLLLTCKRIYQECRLLPIQQHEFVGYFFDGPSQERPEMVVPPGNPQTNPGPRLSALTPAQLNSVQRVHLFIQQCHLEPWSFPWNYVVQEWFAAKTLTLTLRRSDWWSWESHEASTDRLGICPWLPYRTSSQKMEAEPLDPPLDYVRSNIAHVGRLAWGLQIGKQERLEVLELEFETVAKKRDQLDVVVDRAKRWKFPRADETHLCWSGEMRETAWNGPAHPVRERIDARGERSGAEEQIEPPMLTFVVAALKFTRVKS